MRRDDYGSVYQFTRLSFPTFTVIHQLSKLSVIFDFSNIICNLHFLVCTYNYVVPQEYKQSLNNDYIHYIQPTNKTFIFTFLIFFLISFLIMQLVNYIPIYYLFIYRYFILRPLQRVPPEMTLCATKWHACHRLPSPVLGLL